MYTRARAHTHTLISIHKLIPGCPTPRVRPGHKTPTKLLRNIYITLLIHTHPLHHLRSPLSHPKTRHMLHTYVYVHAYMNI